MKKLLILLSVFCLAFSTSFTCFAESVQLDTSSKFAVPNIETIQNIAKTPNSEGTPAQNTNNTNQDSISTNAFSANAITPVFIRSGDSTTVQVYLAYNGTDSANAIKFDTLKINNTSLLWIKTYTPFEGKIYNFGVVSNAYNVYIGNANIPTDVTKVRVSDSGVMAYQIQYGWKGFTNIVGEWTIQ